MTIKKITVAKAVRETGLCNSMAQARRMASQNYILVNGEVKTKLTEKIELKDDTMIEVECGLCRKLVDGMWT